MSVRATVNPVRSAVVPPILEPELHLGAAPAAGAAGGAQLRVPLSALSRGLLVTGAADEVSEIVARLLCQLQMAGVPWLRVGRRPGGGVGPPAAPVTVVDLTDPHGVPLTLNPLRAEPGYPVTAHVSALCAVLQAAFGLPDPCRDVLALALRRGYAAAVGDAADNDAARGVDAAGEAAVITLAQLERAVVRAARELGHDDAMTTTVHGLIRHRLGALCGPATGLLLGGGHPAATGELLRRNVHVVTGDVDGPEGRALLSGSIALRVAEHACRPARDVGTGLRHVLVIEDGGLLSGGSPAARRFGRLLDDAAARGAGIVVTEHAPPPAAAWRTGTVALTTAGEPGATVIRQQGPSQQGPSQPGTAGPAPRGQPPSARGPTWEPRLLSRLPLPGQQSSLAPPEPLNGLIQRRSAGCGRACTTERACTRHEIWLAAGLADAADATAAWLRLWVRALLLGFLTGCCLPPPPPPLRAGWAAQRPRLRECALATVADRAVDSRAAALRDCYPPRALTRAVARAGADLLAGRPVPRVAAQVWVPPQLRWAHEAARVGWGSRSPRGRQAEAAQPDPTVRPDDAAPPLDFALAGLPDWPGIPAAERLRLLLRHPLSLAEQRNRELAGIAVYGEDGRDAFESALAADLAAVLPRRPAGGAAREMAPATAPETWNGHALARRLADATRMPDCPADWLVAVLEWPVTG
jgi:uncharacterized protein